MDSENYEYKYTVPKMMNFEYPVMYVINYVENDIIKIISIEEHT